MNILYIGNALSKHGYNPTTVETLGEKLKNNHNVKISSDSKNHIFRLFDMIITLSRNRNWANVVIIDIYSGLSFIGNCSVIMLCILFKIRYIPIFHGGNLPNRLKKNTYLCRYIFTRSHINISPSGYLYTEFDRYGIESKIIPNFIESDNYKPYLRKKGHISLLYVRAFHSIYNPQMAIDVLNTLRIQGYNAELCMVGPDKDGSMDQCINMIKLLKIDSYVKITGRLHKHEWISLARQSNIFINTTNVDNTPVSVIEAMALGLPIVSTNVGGLPYMIRDGYNGYLSERNNVLAMVNNIIKVSNDLELYSHNAIIESKKYSEKEVLEQWNKILYEINEKNNS